MLHAADNKTVELVYLRGGRVSIATLAANEMQFLYCTADSLILALAAGAKAKLIASPLVGLPWVVIAGKEIRRPEDLIGKILASTHLRGARDLVARAIMK